MNDNIANCQYCGEEKQKTKMKHYNSKKKGERYTCYKCLNKYKIQKYKDSIKDKDNEICNVIDCSDCSLCKEEISKKKHYIKTDDLIDVVCYSCWLIYNKCKKHITILDGLIERLK